MSNLHIEPLTPTIGAEIRGVDLSQPLSQSEVGAIRVALLDHLVVFFRDQFVDVPSLDRLGRCFGEPHVHFASPEGVDGLEGVIKVHADATSKSNAGANWHSDNSFDEIPPMGSILHLHTAPDSGGDTLWANMYAVYEAMSPAMQVFLEGLTAHHDSEPVFSTLFDLRVEDITDGHFHSAVHPVVRTHPETGRKLLYVSPHFTTHFIELERAESDALMAYIAKLIEQPRFHCRFRWSVNTVAFWDNRATQHRAIWDYYPATRTGNRYTVAGDRPVL